MSVSFYFDEQVPSAIALSLKEHGVDVLTVQDDGRIGMEDTSILDRATELGRVLFTRDNDFLVESAKRQEAGVEFSGVIYAHQLRVSIGRCVSNLRLIAEACDADDLVNRVEHLPL